MSCETTRRELIGFHFGELDDGTRSEVERHLVGCRECLGEFLALKRDVELGGAVEERPAPAVKGKLRSAIAIELGLGPTARVWWERPLAFGLAAAAVVVAMVSVQSIATSEPGRAPTIQRAP